MNKFNDIKENLIDMLEELGEDLNTTHDSDNKQTTSSEKRPNSEHHSEDEKFP